MIRFQKILIDIDAAAEKHPALDAAVQLARRCQAQLKIVDVVPQLPWPVRRSAGSAIERDLVAYREERLAGIAGGLASCGLAVGSAVLRGRAAHVLVEEVVGEGHDLLVRSHGRAGSLEPAPRFGAIDMQLLRVCPCPVWLVGARPAHRPLRVLLAVHADPEHPHEQQLNQRIAELASAVVEGEPAELTVVQAWEAFGEQLLRSRMSKEQLAEYVEAARSLVAAAFDEYVASIRPRFAKLAGELVQGPPGQVIPAVAERTSADVVVMGTVARTGIQGLIMGSTAEAVLQQLRCSVLAVKPEGFVSPVRPRER